MTPHSRISSVLAITAITYAAASACCAHLQAQEFSPPDPSSIDAEEVRRIISVLASDDMRGRRAFTEDAERAAAFLAREFEAAGLQRFGGLDGYLQHFSVAGREGPLMNVVGMIPGRRSEEFVLFSAHYDHIGIRPSVNGDSIANGANDDASGTTAVVTLARYFAQRGTPERTLLFAAFTAEEFGGVSSP